MGDEGKLGQGLPRDDYHSNITENNTVYPGRRALCCFHVVARGCKCTLC